MRILAWELVAVCVAACSCVACSSSSSAGGATSTSKVIPACTVPAGADTAPEAGATGCTARTIFQICEVPSGSTVEADGAVSTPDGAPASCKDACSNTEYALTCANASAADSLGCRVLPLPTPAGVTEYCCPCGS